MKGRKERIVKDLTWGERKIKRRLEEITREKERKGNRVWRGYGKLRING